MLVIKTHSDDEAVKLANDSKHVSAPSHSGLL
jgi:hypothetical protein